MKNERVILRKTVPELKFEQAYDMIRTGDIRDGKTIMLLQYAKIHELLA